ncbi:MAG: YcbK family protein [Methylococcaceae bacterium]|nr:YcbK family protein [Methylococcaceae bacterium]
MNDQFLQNPDITESLVISSRRNFLKTIAGVSLLALGLPELSEAAIKRYPSHKTLAFQNAKTGDHLKLTYFENGRYLHDALHEINHLFRDVYNGSVHSIDTALIDQLYDLKTLMGIRKPFDIVSGYRSPHTNAKLRRRSHGVARHSLHMQGRAIDIRIEGVDVRTIRNAALSMRSGGVGYYPRSDFVHLDTGAVRTW